MSKPSKPATPAPDKAAPKTAAKPGDARARTGTAKPGAAAKSRTPRRKSGRGALALIAGLLVAAGVIRIGEGVGKVWALEGLPSGTATSENCTPDAGTAALLEALKAREARLAEDEAALGERRQALNMAESKVTARIEELKAAEAQLSGTLAMADKASETDLATLTTVYENMKPKDAALLFSVMEPDFAAGFLSRMRPENAAGIMAGLSPEVAYAVSAVLAGRNATVPKE